MNKNEMLATIYSDRLFTSTDLNRKSGQILDIALKSPVTITRNNDSFALLKREIMSDLASGIEQTVQIIELLNVAYKIRAGISIEKTNQFKWIEEFDSDEQLDLINEINQALLQAKATGKWDEINAIIHEWRESAIALSSEELSEAFQDR